MQFTCVHVRCLVTVVRSSVLLDRDSLVECLNWVFLINFQGSPLRYSKFTLPVETTWTIVALIEVLHNKKHDKTICK